MASARSRVLPFLSNLARSSHAVRSRLGRREEGFLIGGARRGFGTGPTTEERSSVEWKVENVRREFQEAKKGFASMPSVLQHLPQMEPNGVYVNKNLRLDMVQVYGFDYDYTLAHYSSDLQTLIYDLAKEHLVNELRYPSLCLRTKYDAAFPIRGLYYDRLKGCLLKLDFFGSIEPDGCFFGRRKLSKREIREIYGTRHIGRDQARGLVGLMDFFCFSEAENLLTNFPRNSDPASKKSLTSIEACLIADIVQHFVDAKLEFDPRYIYQDVNSAIQYVHRSGSIHKKILSDPEKYLVKNGQVLRFLRMLKEKGKKLFLLTNSPFYFVDGGMQFMLEDSGNKRESWRELFDVVIAQANKPSFYTSEHPFRFYDVGNDVLAFTAVDSFQPNEVYYHGCLKSFLQITKWNGPEVIYFGDHLFSDLRGPSRAGWRTAAIIHELEKEIKVQNDSQYRFVQAKFHIIQELLGKLHSIVDGSGCGERYHGLLKELNDERRNTRTIMREMFNLSFGATFLTDTGQESAFAYNIHQYADVYTSKPENFLLYPPEAWFHVPYDVKIMPHHVKVPSSIFKT